jgi:Uma2 family endonuclease
MVAPASNTTIEELIYPISDGKPMADGDKQWHWIVYISLGFEAVYEENTEVYVTSDTFWYPVQGEPSKVQAPDTMIVLGRPKEERGAYLQWKEGNIPPQIVFEIWSPSNHQPEMAKKRQFYEEYGVEEYYEYDPERVRLRGWRRQGTKLEEIAKMGGWVSPLTGVRFELERQAKGRELKLYEPDGKPFLTYLELRQARKTAEATLKLEGLLRQRAEQARLQAEQEREQEAQARLQAEQEREQEAQARLRAEQEREQEAQARLEAEERARDVAKERDAAEQKLQELLAKLKAQNIEIPK